MTLPQLSIVLPCYNERENIVPLVARLIEVFAPLGTDLQILVVDDNSPDGTADLVRTHFKDDSRVAVIVRTVNRGLANSIRTGIEQAQGAIVLVMDTDFNHPPEFGPQLVEACKNADFATGSRFIAGGGMPNLLRYALSYVYNIFMRVLLLSRLTDHLSGVFAARSEVLRRLDFDKIFWGYGDYFFRLLVMAENRGFRIVERPVLYGVRPGGQPKTRFMGIFVQYTRELLKLVYWRLAGKW